MHCQDQVRIRVRRHQQLMRMISEYALTEEQIDYLQTIKKNTEIEIASRFLKSKHNKSYRFPLMALPQPEDSQEFPRGISFDHTTYDLRAQNYVTNPEKSQTYRQQTMARRVKSLGPEKLDEKMMKDIRRELRERPKERGGKRERIMLPELNRKVISQKILKPEDKLKQRQFSLKLAKNKNLASARQETGKVRERNMGELLRAKLLTEGGDLLSLGKTKILVSKLRLASPGRQELKGKKLITE